MMRRRPSIKPAPKVALAAALFLLGGAAFAQTPVVRELSARGASGQMDAPIPFSAVGVNWDGGGVVRIRVARNGQAWSEWVAPGADSETRLLFFDPGSRQIQYESEGNATNIRFAFIDPGATPAAKLEELSNRRQRAETTPDGRFAKPPLISRTDWGCPDGELTTHGDLSYTTVTHLIVHHTGDSFPSKDYPAWVRAIWAYHVFSNGWADIGYNYLVDPDGNVYEGRAGGDNVLGAHFSCQNSGTMGVAVLGTFTNVAPTEKAQASLKNILAWKADSDNIDPVGVTFHRGAQIYMNNISGHRDGDSSKTVCTTFTECPGDMQYAMLPQIRQDVAALIGRGPALFSDDAESANKSGWTASGMWHITVRRSTSPTHAWCYGNEETGNYDTPGQSNTGTLESPVIQLHSDASLLFRTWFETEDENSTWDRKQVEINVNGTGWQTIDQLTGPGRQWIAKAYRLPAPSSVQIRFRFDTVDSAYNQFEGWYVDDIAVVKK